MASHLLVPDLQWWCPFSSFFYFEFVFVFKRNHPQQVGPPFFYSSNLHRSLRRRAPLAGSRGGVQGLCGGAARVRQRRGGLRAHRRARASSRLRAFRATAEGDAKSGHQLSHESKPIRESEG